MEKTTNSIETTEEKRKMDFYLDSMKSIIKQALEKELGTFDNEDYRETLTELFYREFPENR